MSQTQDEKSIAPMDTKCEIIVARRVLHVMSDLAKTVHEQQSISQEVRDALMAFDYKPITRLDLGRHMGLNQSELAQLDMFWDPAFGKGWIYLSDDMIKSQMTNEVGKNAVSHFIDRVLDIKEPKMINGIEIKKDYIEGEHFKRLAWDDPLIDLYFKTCSPNLGSNSKRKNVAGKLYYAVSGDTYSDLLSRASTENGKTARSLFRKIIIGTRLMLEYTNTLHAIMAQGRIEEEKTLRIEAESRAITLEKEKRGPKEYPQEWFYIATCDLMAMSRAYKFGIITKSNTPEKRISAYDCGYLEFIALDFVYIIKTHNAKSIEDSFRATVYHYLKDTHKDVVLLSFIVCKLIASAIATCTDGNVATLLDMEKNFPQMMTEPKPVYLTGGGIPKFENGDEAVVKPTESCPKCEKKYINKKALSTHALDCTGPKSAKPRISAKKVATQMMDAQKPSGSTQLTIELVIG